jgi:hypothetical protein
MHLEPGDMSAVQLHARTQPVKGMDQGTGPLDALNSVRVLEADAFQILFLFAARRLDMRLATLLIRSTDVCTHHLGLATLTRS